MRGIEGFNHPDIFSDLISREEIKTRSFHCSAVSFVLCHIVFKELELVYADTSINFHVEPRLLLVAVLHTLHRPNIINVKKREGREQEGRFALTRNRRGWPQTELGDSYAAVAPSQRQAPWRSVSWAPHQTRNVQIAVSNCRPCSRTPSSCTPWSVWCHPRTHRSGNSGSSAAGLQTRERPCPWPFSGSARQRRWPTGRRQTAATQDRSAWQAFQQLSKGQALRLSTCWDVHFLHGVLTKQSGPSMLSMSRFKQRNSPLKLYGQISNRQSILRTDINIFLKNFEATLWQ